LEETVPQRQEGGFRFREFFLRFSKFLPTASGLLFVASEGRTGFLSRGIGFEDGSNQAVRQLMGCGFWFLEWGGFGRCFWEVFLGMGGFGIVLKAD
jgi:hypothetical protein